MPKKPKLSSSISAAELAAMPWEEAKIVALGPAAHAARALDRDDLALKFLHHLDRSETLRGLINGNEEDAFALMLSVGALVDVLINPMGRLHGQRHAMVERESHEGRELTKEIRQYRRCATALRRREKGELAEALEREARELEARFPYEPAGAKQTREGALACELERMLAGASRISAGKRRNLIAGIINEFLEPSEPTNAERIRQLLKETRRRDARPKPASIISVLRGSTRVTGPGVDPNLANDYEVFAAPVPDPGHLSGVRVRILSTDKG